MEENICRFVESKACYFASIVLMLVLGRCALMSVGGSAVALTMNMSAVVLISIVMLRLNLHFNIFEYSYNLYATLYVLLNILFLRQYCQGMSIAVGMAFMMVVCLWIMFSIYENAKYTREIYVIVAIFSTFTLVRPLMCVALPVLIFGFGYIRVFSLKALLAILLGIITPWWLLIVPLEFGLIKLAPFSISPVWMTDEFTIRNIGAIVMLVLGGLLSLTNAFITLSRSSQIYAYFDLSSCMLLTLGVIGAIDFGHVIVYLMPMALFIAIQMSLNYSLIPHKRKYLIFLVILIAIVAYFFIGLTSDSYEVVDRMQYTICQGGA